MKTRIDRARSPRFSLDLWPCVPPIGAMLPFLALLLLLCPPLGQSVLNGGAVLLSHCCDGLLGHVSPGLSGQHSLSAAIPEAEAELPLPEVLGPDDPSRPLIVIDAGHGGHDPGARNPRLDWLEKDLTLGIAKALRDELLRRGRYRVALTRSDDRFLVLQERYGVARRLKAGLFISIHADAAPGGGEAQGATIYTLSEVASDHEAAQLAQRENRSNILNGVDLAGASDAVTTILIDLAQRETLEQSTRFANLVHREGADSMTFRQPFHRSAAFVVLKAPDTPSVLIEVGYITDDGEARRLGSADGQGAIARGIASAITVYFARPAPEGAS
jgi:N-acetylmuramoyl-L-alanine amidase